MRWPWQKPKEEKPKECNHKYKDFPWYYESTYYTQSKWWKMTITAPYVCVICGHRINKVLDEHGSNCTSIADAEKRKDEYLDLLEGRLELRAIVEEMIADTQLVDREFLKYYELVHGDPTEVPKIEVTETPPEESKPHYTSPDQVCQWIMARHGIEPYASHFKDVRGWEVHTIKPLTKEEIENDKM